MARKKKFVPIETEEVLRKQELLYWGSNFLYNKWYRKIFGGKWRLIKFGKDTPAVRLFSTWTKMGNDSWSGYWEIFDEEEYPVTNITTKWQVFIATIKSIFHVR